MIRNVITNIVRIIIFILLFSILPILFIFLPDVFGYYKVIVDLFVFNPLISLIYSSLICINNGFVFYVPVLCGIAFCIVMLIFYDSNRIWFMIVYVICALIGCFIGEKMNKNHKNQLY